MNLLDFCNKYEEMLINREKIEEAIKEAGNQFCILDTK